MISAQDLKGPATYFPSIEKNYGRPMDHWFNLVHEQNGMKHMDVVSWLNTDTDWDTDTPMQLWRIALLKRKLNTVDCCELWLLRSFKHWGRGYSTEAASVVIEHLLRKGARRVMATVTVGDDVSMAVLKKLGFRYTRMIQDNDMIRGAPVDDAECVLISPS
jgi:RimJ/RimL family protein N-acetyltransferase